IEIKVIANGVETDIFLPREKVKPIDNKLNIITVTRLIERKGVQHILKALSELRNDDRYNENLSLLVVGTGNYESQLKNLCKQLHLEDMVTFYGFCPRYDLPELYRNSDIFALPSMAESFGIVFAEAMACELPVISTKAGNIPELVEDHHGILVESNNVEALKQAILYMIKNQEKWNAMGRASREKICKEYSWEGVAEKYSFACAMH
ncbi:glycosyltransferase family 4 protein, partial [bacterium]|nr:glycosyltransferase family 4 protein [bacterium]